MQESTTLEKLSQKVNQMLRNYDELRKQNSELKEKIERLELDHSAKEAAVIQMQDELTEKDREIEEIVTKIESMLG